MNNVKEAKINDLKDLWNDSDDVSEFYTNLKDPPFHISDEVMLEFEDFIKESKVDIYQSFIHGVRNISESNLVLNPVQEEFDKVYNELTKENTQTETLK